jgi:hypothetical protein
VEFWEGKVPAQFQGLPRIHNEGDNTGSGRGGYRAPDGDGVGGVEVGKRGGDDDARRGMPLAFFRFETPRDGEDLKEEFKRGFEEAGKVLTVKEREEVVEEVQRIFEDLTSLVASLLETLGKDSDGPGSGTGSGIVSRWVDWVTARLGWKGTEGRASEFRKRDPHTKRGRAKKVVRFEEAALHGRAGEQAAQGLALGLGAWSLVLGLVIIGSALALAYAWR